MAHLVERLVGGRRAGVPMALGLAVATANCHRPPAPSLANPTYTVEPRAFEVTIGAVGAVAPAAHDEVTAPFDGIVARVDAEFGDTVTAGQPLLAMATGDLTQSLREASAEMLKASQTDLDVRGWRSGGEVARARRGVASAEAALKSLEARLATTKGLLDRGLVARDEYQGLVEQRLLGELALASAQDDLAASLKKGAPDAWEVADLELQNARAKLGDLQDEFAHARVTALATGVMIRPVAAKADEASSGLRLGAHVLRGQVLAEIARSGDLAVTIKLDEADVNKIHTGMAATVTGSGFPGFVLPGRVVNLSSQAQSADAVSPGGMGGGVSFPAIILLDHLSPEEARLVHIGMTANVVITVRRAAAALVVPPQAIQGEGPSATVLVIDPKTMKPIARAVTIAGVAPDGVEVRAGLRAGDQVTWQAIATPAPSP